MSRRQVKTEQEFGSDSFLDVIANIVGILIILIVIVGLKVARQPAARDSAEANTTIAAVPSPAESLADPDSQIHHQLQSGRQQLAELQQEHAHLNTSITGLIAVDAEVLQEHDALKSDQQTATRQLTVLREQTGSDRAKVVESSKNQQELADALRSLKQQIDQQQREQQQVAQALVTAVTERDTLDKSLQQVAFETQQLQEVLGELSEDAGPKEMLQHRLSPVSEQVEAGEVHFRVEHGMVSHVPLDELLERLKSQVQSRRAAVTRLSHYEGNVGPVQGYRMTYTVERDSLSPLESLQHGNGTYRISVTRWTIQPEASLRSEGIEEALQPGSQFRQIVETAPPGSAATFWVYPDSFEDFPRLREVAHGLQLRVAARPLPEGTPIVGSPGGSRSTAQ